VLWVYMKSASSTRLAVSRISMSVYMLYMILFCEVAGLCRGCVGLYPHTLSRILKHTQTYARARAHTHTHKCAFTQEHDMQVWGDFYTHVRARACTHTHTQTHTHTHTHTLVHPHRSTTCRCGVTFTCAITAATRPLPTTSAAPLAPLPLRATDFLLPKSARLCLFVRLLCPFFFSSTSSTSATDFCISLSLFFY